MMNIRQNKGFTLIELIIVVAVIGILVAIAYPLFEDTVRKSRRSDAMNALTTIQLNQVKWRANNTTYTSTLPDVWGGTSNGATYSSDEYYTIAIGDPGAGYGLSFRLTATPRSSQTDDTECANFILTYSSGASTKTISGTGNADRCWKR